MEWLSSSRFGLAYQGIHSYRILFFKGWIAYDSYIIILFGSLQQLCKVDTKAITKTSFYKLGNSWLRCQLIFYEKVLE